MKTITKNAMNITTQCVQQEINILSSLDHPNLVSFVDSYEDCEHYHIVTEYCAGGEIMERYAKKGGFSESEVTEIMYQAFSAVDYLHEMGITHRDIKPENFLFKRDDIDDFSIKLIDFGFATYFNEDTPITSNIVGTPSYLAPEMIEGAHDQRCDNWSLGVVMYVLITGHFPFSGERTTKLFKAIRESRLDLSGRYWKDISKEAKQVVKGLLEKDPKKRMTAKQALEHRWIKERQSLLPKGERVSVAVSDVTDQPRLSDEKTISNNSTQTGANSRNESFEERRSFKDETPCVLQEEITPD